MKNLIKVLMIVIVAIGVSSCNGIDGRSNGEHIVSYYGNIVGVKLTPGDCGYVRIPVDVDNSGETDFSVILPNSYIDEVEQIGDEVVTLRVVSRKTASFWYVVDVISQAKIKYYLWLETQNPDTDEDSTKIVIK